MDERYSEIEERAENFETAANVLVQPDEAEAQVRRPVPPRGHGAIVAGLLCVAARIEALTYVIQRLEDPDKDREKDRNP